MATSTTDREALAAIARAAHGGVITLDSAARAIRMPAAKVSALLGRLIRRGWIERVRRGLYLVKPVEARPDQIAIPEDPWLLAQAAFSPCYIAGWSATEYWDLTEQLFRSTVVVTAAQSRNTIVRLGGHDFRLFRVPRSRLGTGVVKVWRGSERVAVSGLERTIVDALRHPDLVGGGRHLIQVLRAYGEHDKHDFARLLDVAEKEASGAAWKRLGLLAERLWPEEGAVLDTARRRLTAGYAKLDPNVRQRGKLVTRWRLIVNTAADELASGPDAA